MLDGKFLGRSTNSSIPTLKQPKPFNKQNKTINKRQKRQGKISQWNSSSW